MHGLFKFARLAFGLGFLFLAALAVIGWQDAPPTPASAASSSPAAVPQSVFLHYLVNKTAPHVIVWRDAAAYDQGMKLIGSGEAQSHAELMQQFVACFADSGSKIIFTDSGVFTVGVRVISGASDGCTGVVSATFVQSTPT